MRILTFITFVCLLFLASFRSFAQEPFDSLLSQIKADRDSTEVHIIGLKDAYEQALGSQENADSLRFELYFALQSYYDQNFRLDSTYSYAMKAKEYLDTSYLSTSSFYEALSLAHFQQSKYELALAQYDSAIAFAKRDGLYQILPGMYTRKSVVHNTLRDRTGELESLETAIHLADSLEIYQDKASAAINLGIALYESKLYDDAIGQLSDALVMVRDLEDAYTKKLLKTFAFVNLANIYGDLKQTDTSFIFLDSAEKYVDPQYQHIIAYINNTRGNNLSELNRFEEAFPYLKQAYETFDALYMTEAKVGSAGHYANCLVELGRWQEADSICLQVLDYAKEQQDFMGLINLHKVLAATSMYKGEKDNVLEHMTLALDYKDSARQFAQDERMAMLRTEYELIAKEQENKFLAEQNELKDLSISRGNTINILAGTLVVLALITLIFLYRDQRKLKRQQALLHTQNEQLLSLNEGNKRLIALISHDVRGPIGTAEQALGMAKESDPETKDYLVNQVHDSLRSLFELIDSLLNWARTNNGLSGYFPTQNNLPEIASDIVKLYKHSLAHKNINVKVAVEPDLFLFADTDMLKTMLRNLMTNAIKFSKKDSTIELHGEQASEWILISVRDYGLGMTEEQIDAIRSGDASVTKGSHDEIGTGLGMNLVLSLVQRHKGKMEIDSAPGKGTMFTLFFPKV
jgi:signal transduction histidine kinase